MSTPIDGVPNPSGKGMVYSVRDNRAEQPVHVTPAIQAELEERGCRVHEKSGGNGKRWPENRLNPAPKHTGHH